MALATIQLTEWQTRTPEEDSQLRGIDLTEEGRTVAKELKKSRQLEVLELAQGLQLKSSSWVGRVQLGGLQVSIRPKISGAPFLRLVRYAFGLRRLATKDPTAYGGERGTFQDLIARQLASEIEELVARGLHRDYRHDTAELALPSGRIDFQRYVTAAGGGRASLPCTHYPRTCETILNQTLLAGTVLAARATDDLELRSQLRRLGKALGIARLPQLPSTELLDRSTRLIDRRTRAYEPALKLIGLLIEGLGISLSDRTDGFRLPGFLFDMNRFFQALLSRFLRENLQDHWVRDEQRLIGMFAYSPGDHLPGHPAPTPRPDFLILSGRRVASVLDAKYRDLSLNPLPREMLYQLAIYALSRSGPNRQAVILYPTLAVTARDRTILMREPVRGAEQAQIVLRPVELLELESLVGGRPSVARERQCAAFAERLVFGLDAESGVRR